jgi:amidase
VPAKLPHPMPISLTIWGGPGDEPTLIKVASAYEAATHHRKPPPMFPPLKGEP